MCVETFFSQNLCLKEAKRLWFRQANKTNTGTINTTWGSYQKQFTWFYNIFFIIRNTFLSFLFFFLSLSPFFDDLLVVRAWRKSWSRSKSPGPRGKYGNSCEYLQMVFNTRFQSFHLFQFKTNFMWNMLQWCFTNESLNDDDIPILWKVEWVKYSTWS